MLSLRWLFGKDWATCKMTSVGLNWGSSHWTPCEHQAWFTVYGFHSLICGQLHSVAYMVNVTNIIRSPALLPKPDDWQAHIDVTGFNFLPADNDYEPPLDLLEFLESGPPPIYIGFGSIVVDDPDGLTQTILDAVLSTGQRALISKGWGGLGAESLQHKDIFFLGNCPHDWLFQRVSCVIHHGGAGTTAMGLAMGRPTAVVPFFGDQPFWGALVAANQAGPWPIPFRDLTPERLADAIYKCLTPATIAKAQELSERIRSEDGPEQGVASFHRQLKMDRMRCSLCPDRTAVWRVRKTKILLSPLAASVLVRGGHLDPHDVKLYVACSRCIAVARLTISATVRKATIRIRIPEDLSMQAPRELQGQWGIS